MKINGKVISNRNKVPIVLPRADGDDIILIAKAILDSSDFDKLYPEPIVPNKQIRNKVTDLMEVVPDYDNKEYRASIDVRDTAREHWMIIKSIMETPGLEFDKIKYNDSSTWSLLREELRDAGISNSEYNLILRSVFEANSLDEKKLEDARNRFILAQVTPLGV